MTINKASGRKERRGREAERPWRIKGKREKEMGEWRSKYERADLARHPRARAKERARLIETSVEQL